MKAMVQDTYGSADVLELRDVDLPEIKDGDVHVRVYAAAVDHGVWHLMTGLPYRVRIKGYGLGAPKTRVRGFDAASIESRFPSVRHSACHRQNAYRDNGAQ